jgi:YVTN family beta-propeller protein
MNVRISGLIAAVAFAGILGSTQILAQNAYITNSSSNNVSVIDMEKNKVIATIVGSFFSPYGVAVSPDGSKVYVTNSTSKVNSTGTVSVIDTAKNKVIATIPCCGDLGIAVSPDGSKVYALNGVNSVAVIDTATNTVITTVPVGVGILYGVAASPDGSKVYVTNIVPNDPSARGTVSVIDTATNTVTATILVDVFPTGVAATADGRKVYVANQNSATVSVIDAETNTVTTTIAVGSVPTGVAVTPGRLSIIERRTGRHHHGTLRSKVYVANVASNTVSVIDTANDTVSATIYVGTNRGPNGVAVTPDGEKVYVTNAFSNNVSVIDTTKNKVIATIPVGLNPNAFGMFIQPAQPTPRFAGTPGEANCYGQSFPALTQQYHGLDAAATALGFSSVRALQIAILEFCEG